MPKIHEIIDLIEAAAPRAWQESWDNAGWQVSPSGLSAVSAAGVSTISASAEECTGVLLTLDVTEAAVDEAIGRGCNLILSHHPLLFSGLKRITSSTPTERIVAQAIRHDIAIYSAHTNMDSAPGGVNFALAEKLGLTDIKVLVPRESDLVKLVFYTPLAHADGVRSAVFAAGAGSVGGYDSCSYNSDGTGTFCAVSAECRPYVGVVGELHREPETRTETVVPRCLLSGVVAALLRAHPYEVPAYDVIPLEWPNMSVGLGCVGNLPSAVPTAEFLQHIAKMLNISYLRHSGIATDAVRRVALCGGSGSEFVGAAIASGAEFYLTADLKYHDFQRGEGRITLADAGHYETEVQVLDVFYDLISKKIPNFAVHCIRTDSNPVHYCTQNAENK